VTDRASAENTFKLLPLSLLALRVTKVDGDAPGHEGHNHAKKKHVKGLWDVRIEQHQEANDDNYYIWLYEGSQWKQKLYAGGALLLVIAIVLFPLWPLFMRQGVWYLSMGVLGLIGLFFAMAIVRLILFIMTMFTVSPGLWLYPNLFEDVGFFDSFRPVWAWHEVSCHEVAHAPSHESTNNPRLLMISRQRNRPRRRKKPPSKLPELAPTDSLSRRTRKAMLHHCRLRLPPFLCPSRIVRQRLIRPHSPQGRKPCLQAPWCNGRHLEQLWRRRRRRKSRS
jgi:protein translocation Sec62 family protein